MKKKKAVKRKKKITGKMLGRLVSVSAAIVAAKMLFDGTLIKKIKVSCSTHCNFPKCSLKGCMMKSDKWQ